MSLQDEPLLGRKTEPERRVISNDDLSGHIRRLLDEQLYGVLCTQGQTQPYGSVVAFAANKSLKEIVFATPITTRKFRLLSECDRVAFVVDNRAKFPKELTKVEAITGTGRAEQIQRGPDFDLWSRLLIARHPHLKSFVCAPSCALIRISVTRYFHVTRFQEVQQWTPTA